MNDKQGNPWVGLSTYTEEDKAIFCGRDKDIRNLTQFVLRCPYTLFYGKSGVGKSSLLNKAIIPAIKRQGFTPVNLRLTHDKDATGYLSQIRQSIENLLIEEKKAINVTEVAPSLGEDDNSLYEYFHRHKFFNNDGSEAKLFFFFDQFEEIFTLQEVEKKRRDFFDQLADLCNDWLPNYMTDLEQSTHNYVNDNVVRLVFTFREDFLSEVEYYTSNIALLKSNRYLLRPLDEEQAAQIITEPRSGLFNENEINDVAWLIINKVTGNEKFKIDGNPEIEVDAAILSLFLSRLYDSRTDEGKITKDLVEQNDKGILSGFYREAMSEVSQATVDYLEGALLTDEGRRDNITKETAIKNGVTEAELDTLIEKKKVLQSFKYSGVDRIEYRHDVLCRVAAEHKIERCIESERVAAKQKIEKERRYAKKKLKNRLLIAIVLIFIAFVFLDPTSWEHRQVYKDFRINDDGFPEGVGQKLSKGINQVAIQYELKQRGQDPPVCVTLLNTNIKHTKDIIKDLLPPMPDEDADSISKYNNLFEKITQWCFFVNDKGYFEDDIKDENTITQVAFDKNGEIIYFFYQYKQPTNENIINCQMIIMEDNIPLRVFYWYMNKTHM